MYVYCALSDKETIILQTSYIHVLLCTQTVYIHVCGLSVYTDSVHRQYTYMHEYCIHVCILSAILLFLACVCVYAGSKSEFCSRDNKNLEILNRGKESKLNMVGGESQLCARRIRTRVSVWICVCIHKLCGN